MFGELASESMIGLYLTDEEIYDHYFDYSETKKFHSPFRNDPGPSLSFKMNPDGSVMWKDFGMSKEEQRWFDPIGFVAKLKDLSRYKATQLIWRNLVLERDRNFDDLNKEVRDVVSRTYDLDYEPITEQTMDYWKRYHVITLGILRKARVYKLNRMYFKGEPRWGWKDEDPTFLYMINKKKHSYKIYRPFGEEFDGPGNKFRSENLSQQLECLYLTDRPSDTLIITKSTKDAMVLYALGYNAVAPTGEHSLSGFVAWMGRLYKRFPNIIVLFDNDEAGIEAARNVRSKWKYVKGSFVMSRKEEEKDVSDFIEIHGPKLTKQVVDESVDYILNNIAA